MFEHPAQIGAAPARVRRPASLLTLNVRRSLMLTVCFAAKGGSGTTVVAAALATTGVGMTVLVDLAGDLPAVLGLDEPDGPGVGDWLVSDAPAGQLDALAIRTGEHLRLVPTGRRIDAASARWAELCAWAGEHAHVIVDAGTGEPPAALAAAADRLVLVTRPCYLGLRAAVRLRARATCAVLIAEPGRALSAADVAASIGAPVVATVLLDPAVARAVDAGLLAARLPHAFRRALRGVS
jgi:hypothetical protein